MDITEYYALFNEFKLIVKSVFSVYFHQYSITT